LFVLFVFGLQSFNPMIYKRFVFSLFCFFFCVFYKIQSWANATVSCALLLTFSLN